MTATLTQTNGVFLGDSIPAELDTTSTYCIFNVINDGYRKQRPVHITTCTIADGGFVAASATTWKDMTTWNPNEGFYDLTNLNGCVPSKIFIIFETHLLL